jgi:hypothetical protein
MARAAPTASYPSRVEFRKIEVKELKPADDSER